MGFTYVNFGDSISEVCANGRNFPWLIRDYIEANYTLIKLINKAKSGLTCDRAIKGKSGFCQFDAYLVTICLGMNDIGDGSNITAYKDNLRTIIDFLRERSPEVKVILCTLPGIDITNRISTIDLYRTAIEEIAEEKNTYLCKFHEALSDDMTDQDYWSEVNVAEKLHPNEAGHQLLFDKLIPIIDEILK